MMVDGATDTFCAAVAAAEKRSQGQKITWNTFFIIQNI